MKPGSFEEQLNKAANEFTLQHREGMWQHIDVALGREKGRKTMPLMWSVAGALLYVFAVLMNPVQRVANLQVNKATTPTAAQAHAPQVNIHSEDKTTKGQHRETGKIFSIAGAYGHSLTKPFQHLGAATQKVFTDENIGQDPFSLLMKSNEQANVLNSMPELMQQKEKLQELSPETIREASTDSVIAQAGAISDTARQQAKNEINVPKASRFYAGITFAYGQSLTMVRVNQKGVHNSNDYNNRKETDRPGSAYTFGITGGLSKGRHRMETGLQYSYASYDVRIKNIEPPVVTTTAPLNPLRMNTNDSFLLTGSSGDGDYFHTEFHFITVPISYSNVVWKRQNWNVSLNTQLAYNRMVASNALMYDPEKGYYVLKHMNDNMDLRKNNFAFLCGAEFSYKLVRSVELSVRPQWGRTLNPLEKGALRTGMQFRNVAFGLRWIF